MTLALPLLTHAQDVKSDYAAIGLSSCIAKQKAITGKNAIGVTFAGQRQMNPYYAFGLSADFISSYESMEIHIPNNLQSNESLNSEFTMLALYTVHHIDLNSKARIKWFIEGKVGFRVTKFSVIHEGYFLLLLKSEEELFKNNSGGLAAIISTGVYIPFTKSPESRFGLYLKTGMHSGTPGVKYIELTSIYYDSGTFRTGMVKRSNAAYWINSVDFVWRLSRNNKSKKA